MYTFIENGKLFIILPQNGRVYQIYNNYQEPYFVLDRIIQYQVDVDELIKSTNAISVRS